MIHTRCCDLSEAETAYWKYVLLYMKIHITQYAGDLTGYSIDMNFDPPHRGTDICNFWLTLQNAILDLDMCILPPNTYLGEQPWGLRLKEIAIEEAQKNLDELPEIKDALEARIDSVNAEITELEELLAYYDDILDDPETDEETFWETLDLYWETEAALEAKQDALLLLQDELNALPTTEEAQQAVADAQANKVAFEAEEISYDSRDLLNYLKAPLPFIVGIGDSFRARKSETAADYEYHVIDRGDFLGDWIVEDINTCLDEAEYFLGYAPVYQSIEDYDYDRHEWMEVEDGVWTPHESETETIDTDVASVNSHSDALAYFQSLISYNSSLYNSQITRLSEAISTYQNGLKQAKVSKDLSEPIPDIDFDTGELLNQVEFTAWRVDAKANYSLVENTYQNADKFVNASLTYTFEGADFSELEPYDAYCSLHENIDVEDIAIERLQIKRYIHTDPDTGDKVCDGYENSWRHEKWDKRIYFGSVANVYDVCYLEKQYDITCEEGFSYGAHTATVPEGLPTIVENVTAFTPAYYATHEEVVTTTNPANDNLPPFDSVSTYTNKFGEYDLEIYLKLK